MGSPLTIPGEIPGLLRRGSPILERGEPGLYVDDGADTMGSTCRVFLTKLFRQGCVPVSLVALDLQDATGRAHAAWWLASAVKSVRGAILATGGARWHMSRRGYWEMWADRTDASRWQEVAFVPWGGTVFDSMNGTWTRYVPILASLNPSDPRLLPDGSRHVDAEALRLVCLHVWGEMQAKGGE